MAEKLIERVCIICERNLSSKLTGKIRQTIVEYPEQATSFIIRNEQGSELDYTAGGILTLEVCICDNCLYLKKKFLNKMIAENIGAARQDT